MMRCAQRPSHLTATLLTLAGLTLAGSADAAPLSRHPSNGHYFLFRDSPTVLITSGEHYGAVINLDFDYVAYLDELEDKGLNLTRLFSGTYVERPDSFGIQKNTVGPLDGRFLSPWARSQTPGYAAGGNKFDLSKFDDAYFTRLKDFVSKAGERGIVVEFVLFCVVYEDSMWNLSPMKASNNVNGIGNVDRTTAMSTNNGGLLAIQDAFVRKVAQELETFDNVYYEVVNEPYIGNGVTDAFQEHIIATLADAEAGFAAPHLIAQNYCNDTCQVNAPNPQVSILNFHYAAPPSAVATNYGLNLILAFDETGFQGGGDDAYRRQAWPFIVAGGALFSNLDYSFTPDNEAGDFNHTSSPGGGSAAFRSQLKVLKDFIHGFDFIDMQPAPNVIKAGAPGNSYVLAELGHQYAIYLGSGTSAELQVELPAESYVATWLNTKTGALAKTEPFTHAGGTRTLSSPAYDQEIALSIKSQAEIAEVDPLPMGGAGGQAGAGGAGSGGSSTGGNAAGPSAGTSGASSQGGMSAIPGPTGTAGHSGTVGVTAAGPADPSGCACRSSTPGAGAGKAWSFAALLTALGVALARRRRVAASR